MNTTNRILPLPIMYGNLKEFETDLTSEKMSYNPFTQKVDIIYFGDVPTGGTIGTKSLKSAVTKTSGGRDAQNESKNQIDDAKSKDKK